MSDAAAFDHEQMVCSFTANGTLKEIQDAFNDAHKANVDAQILKYGPQFRLREELGGGLVRYHVLVDKTSLLHESDELGKARQKALDQALRFATDAIRKLPERMQPRLIVPK